MNKLYFTNLQEAHLFAGRNRAEGRFADVLHQNAGVLWGEACGVAVVYSEESVEGGENNSWQTSSSPFQLPNIVSSVAWYFVVLGVFVIGIGLLVAAILHPLSLVVAFIVGITVGILTSVLPKIANTIEKLLQSSTGLTSFRIGMAILMMISIQNLCVYNSDGHFDSQKSAIGAIQGRQVDPWAVYEKGVIAM